MDKEIIVNLHECKIPRCLNTRDIENSFPICRSCMANTVRNFFRASSNLSPSYTTAMDFLHHQARILVNLERLIELESLSLEAEDKK